MNLSTRHWWPDLPMRHWARGYGRDTLLRDARSARISGEDEAAFAQHVASLLDSAEDRRALAEAGPLDARAWSTEVLMRRAVELYASLARPMPALA